ncbi:MAG: nitrous oxide reductase accessory protein NosL [Desulfobacterota bacterium]|jgi:nitrous oxide reductase accessory protein NosL|nr:nitrous oxide reductase accessory protein NosL [Thermodesulfobacteriota bacterium]
MRIIKYGSQTVAALVILLLVLSVGSALAQDPACHYCGMRKSMFGHSWVVLEYEVGAKAGLCSIHCAVIHMALSTERMITKVTVGDYNTKEQIDAERAYWVIGGNKMGVMTARAKWAFKTKDAADKFTAENGGRPATYEEAVKAAFEDMYEDTLMIQKKRRMLKMHTN